MAPGNIDLSRVNLSLAAFQQMADGKYNAGEVRLSGETGLKKVNNHIHRLGANKVEIPHEEVLAIKAAFVKALSSNGVGKDEINKIRRELGLAPDANTDMQLRKRSITPLTRQQIRDIIDRNVGSLGAAVQDGTIRTSDQLYGGLTEKEKTRRAGRREEAAVARADNAGIDENRPFTLLQELLGGTSDFLPYEDRVIVLDTARQQAENVMKACNGEPSDTKECVLTFKTESGATIEIPTGFSEKKFLETIDETCLRLCYIGVPDRKILDARRQFLDLPAAARRQYFLDLSDTGERAQTGAADRLKARTALVAMLQERGIGDFKTLSLVNKLPMSQLKLTAETLLSTLKNATGDALRNSRFMRLLAFSVRNAPQISQFETTTIPAFEPELQTDRIAHAITAENRNLPPGIRRIMEQLRADMHARFGDAVPADSQLNYLLEGTTINRHCDALAKEGKFATADNIREALESAFLERAVFNCIEKAAPRFLDKHGGGNTVQYASLARKVCPQLAADLRAAQNPQEAAAALDRHAEALDRIAARMGPCNRNERTVVALYRGEFARALGLDVDSPVVQRAEAEYFKQAAGNLTDQICSGELPFDTAEKIDAAFAKFATDQARRRATLIRQAGDYCQSPLAAGMLRRHILVIARPEKFKFDAFKAEAGKMKPQAEKVARLIDSGASVDEICTALGDLFKTCKNKTVDLYKKGPFDEVGSDDFFAYGIPMQILAVDAVPGLMDKIQAFYDRPDVKTLDFENENTVASNAKSLRYALDKAAELPVEPGPAPQDA